MKGHVFAVPVLDRWLVYAPLHRLAAVVNGSAIQALRCGRAGNGGTPVAELLERLRPPPPSQPRPIDGGLCPSFLGLIPTRGCNLACVYCSFGGPSAEKVHMRPEIAVAAVDWMVECLVGRGHRNLQVRLFGGEPFSSPDVVDVVVHRVRAQSARHGLVPYLAASTNGVFSEDRAEFVGDYFDEIVLSLDGPAEIHDRHRPAFGGRPSFDAVSRTAKRLAEAPVGLCLRACVTEGSVGEMEAVARWMIRVFSPTALTFESLMPGALAHDAGLEVPDPYRFATHCVGALRVGEEMGVRVVYAAAETKDPRLTSCPVGTDAVIVSPDGRASACYLLPEAWRARGLDMDVGRVCADGHVSIDRVALERARRLPSRKPRCERCFCRWTCAGGCHVDQTYPGSSKDYTPLCLQTRLVTACVLLRDVGCDDLVSALLEDRLAMERLAEHPFDLADLAWDGREHEWIGASLSAPQVQRDRPPTCEGQVQAP